VTEEDVLDLDTLALVEFGPTGWTKPPDSAQSGPTGWTKSPESAQTSPTGWTKSLDSAQTSPTSQTKSLDSAQISPTSCTKPALRIIDQTKLPGKVEFLLLYDLEEIREAIYLLKVRGAPAIGVAAAIGIYVVAWGIYQDLGPEGEDSFFFRFEAAHSRLAAARPTAVNLSWALNRMNRVLRQHRDRPIPEILILLRQEALAIRDEDIASCRSIGEHGLSLIKDGDGLLTHCNAGQLAAVRYGTALAPIYLGLERGYRFKVYADETRPLLQGARLTAFELERAGVPTVLICDNMASQVMENGWVQAIFVGCDRMAANGDACNKIGTRGLAIIARHYGIPFYVCLPFSTVDLSMSTGKDIPIEERDPTEVSHMWYTAPMAPPGLGIFNPAFDVTDHELITAVVSDRGIARPPYTESLSRLGSQGTGI